jgi:3-oxoacyl-[acyl-carrier protein] reductase
VIDQQLEGNLVGVLDSMTALVTGGSRGIGRAIAERLARDGATVAITYATNCAAADDVVARIHAEGGQAVALRAELGAHDDAAQLWSAFDAALPGGRVDIIVNNAGISCYADISALTEDDFDRVFAVNVRSPFFIVQHGLSRIPDGGRIINISSGAARLALPGAIAYGSTKAALDTFTLNLAKQLGPRRITVNSLAPGITDTEMNASWLRGNPEAESDAAALAALGRVGTSADIADIVAFLASDDARWITGRVVCSSGSRSRAPAR